MVSELILNKSYLIIAENPL